MSSIETILRMSAEHIAELAGEDKKKFGSLCGHRHENDKHWGHKWCWYCEVEQHDFSKAISDKTTIWCEQCGYFMSKEDFDAGKGRIMFNDLKCESETGYRCGVCDDRVDDPEGMFPNEEEEEEDEIYCHNEKPCGYCSYIYEGCDEWGTKEENAKWICPKCRDEKEEKRIYSVNPNCSSCWGNGGGGCECAFKMFEPMLDIHKINCLGNVVRKD